MRLRHSATCGYHQGIVWSSCVETAPVSTASGSTINGGFASPGQRPARLTSRSPITTDGGEEDDMSTAHAPIHPGEVLLEEFLAPLGISQYRLAQAIAVPPRRINEIVHRKRAISPDTAL